MELYTDSDLNRWHWVLEEVVSEVRTQDQAPTQPKVLSKDFTGSGAFLFDHPATWSSLVINRANTKLFYNPAQARDERGRWSDDGGHGPLTSRAPGDWRRANGRRLDAETQARIKELRIPPGWKEVELNPDPDAKLQAIGVDSKGRYQYIYSVAHSERAAAEKFARLKEFHTALPGIRESIAQDLKDENIHPTMRESAIVLSLIDKTGFRVGGEAESLAAVKAYGATTLEASHVEIRSDKIMFEFTGKKGVNIVKTLEDKELASILKPRLRAGGRLFQVNASQVREYLHSKAEGFKVKDFRTWHGTNKALEVMQSLEIPTTQRAFIKARKEVATAVSKHLGNTPTVALGSYIDPSVWSSWDKAGWGKKTKKHTLISPTLLVFTEWDEAKHQSRASHLMRKEQSGARAPWRKPKRHHILGLWSTLNIHRAGSKLYYDSKQPRDADGRFGSTDTVTSIGNEQEALTSFGAKSDIPSWDSNWLSTKQAQAEAQAKQALKQGWHESWSKHLLTGSVTADIQEVWLDPKEVARLPGLLGEEVTRGRGPKAQALRESLQGGWDKDKGGPVFVVVNHKGGAFIAEGNNRAVVAQELGLKSIPVNVRYWNGAELNSSSPMSPTRLRKIQVSQ